MYTFRIGLFAALVSTATAFGQAKVVPAGSSIATTSGGKVRFNAGLDATAPVTTNPTWSNARTAPAAKQAGSAAAPRTFTILYDWAPTSDPTINGILEKARAKPYILVYQNVDLPSIKSCVIDSSKIIADVRQRFGNNPTGWGMLDFEDPFDAVLQSGPSHPKYETCVRSMVQAIRDTKRAFPNVKWTYYGIPGLAYWPGGSLWANASPEKRAAEVERQVQGYGPVLAELDWFSPCLYDVYRLDTMTPEAQAAHLVNEREYRIARIGVIREFLRRNNLPARPIIPSVSPFYGPGGNTTENDVIPRDEVIRDQILPVIAAGADGIAIWSCANWYVQQATLPTDPNNRTQQRVRGSYRSGFLAGSEPTAWNSPSMKAMLTRRVGNAVASMGYYAREAARVKKVDQGTSALVGKP
jgi:hypothetical protein